MAAKGLDIASCSRSGEGFHRSDGYCVAEGLQRQRSEKGRSEVEGNPRGGQRPGGFVEQHGREVAREYGGCVVESAVAWNLDGSHPEHASQRPCGDQGALIARDCRCNAFELWQALWTWKGHEGVEAAARVVGSESVDLGGSRRMKHDRARREGSGGGFDGVVGDGQQDDVGVWGTFPANEVYGRSGVDEQAFERRSEPAATDDSNVQAGSR